MATPEEIMLSADEKTSVHCRAKLFGRCEHETEITPLERLKVKCPGIDTSS